MISVKYRWVPVPSPGASDPVGGERLQLGVCGRRGGLGAPGAGAHGVRGRAARHAVRRRARHHHERPVLGSHLRRSLLHYIFCPNYT